MRKLRKLIRENIEKFLNESMDMGIENFQYEDELENVLDISNYVVKKIAYDLWPKLNLTKEEEEAIGGIGDDFTPDGNDAFETTGIMNFYVGGYPDRVIDKILGYIKYILNERDIKVGEFKREKVKDKLSPEELEKWEITDGGESLRVIRIPIIENGSGISSNPPTVNFSNANAHKIFGEILGFENMDSFYKMNVAELLIRVDKARKSMLLRTDIPDTSQEVVKGNMYHTINGKEYYYSVFDNIQDFARWASVRGYQNLHVA